MKFTKQQFEQMSNAVRAGALRAVRAARSGHVGIALGAADIIAVIYAKYMPQSEMNKFILSAGHGSALLYSVLKLSGFDLPPLETFRKLGGLPGHPERDIPGVCATTGPLGQGVANAAGMAMGYKIKFAEKNKAGAESPQSLGKVYCLCSDGDLMEGVAQEAIAFAGRYKLNNLIMLWDDNGVSIDGVALTDENIAARMKSAGFETLSCNGNKHAEIDAALDYAQKSKKPVFIRCRTVIGLGSGIAGTAEAHALSLSDSQLAELVEKFDSQQGAQLWRQIGKARESRPAEYARIKTAAEFAFEGGASSRELSGKYLELLLAANDGGIIGGSADLSESTCTRVAGSRDISVTSFDGNFIHYGVREHAMAAIMNGLALTGFRPYGGTFLVFSDYMRAAMRLSAMMGLPVVYVLTHDSIALGEDGPTHQPIEQLAGLRLIPNMNVFRPCGAAEVKWAWDAALSETSRPTAIVLSRQKLGQIPAAPNADMDKGAYLVKTQNESRLRRITLIATGGEVPLAIEVAEKIGASVVSMPSVERFRLQSAEYKNKILSGRVIALEAGATAGWYEFADAVVGIDSFGASGGGAEVYRRFGFDAEIIARDIIKNFK